MEQDDDVHFNEPAPILANEKIGTGEDPLTDMKRTPAEGPKLAKTAIAASEDATVTPQPVVVLFIAAAFKKPVESISHSLFSFSSKSAEKFPAVPSEYGEKVEPIVDSSSRLVP